MTSVSGLELLLEYLTKYFPVLLFIVVALAFGVVTLLLSYLVQPKYPEPEKLSAYECGSEPFSDARMPFPVRYYIFAMLFVIFDIEVIFLYPWAVVFRQLGWFGFAEMLVFLGASYLRMVGRDQNYGLSARGLAVDTAMPRGEEFPGFTEFWLVRPAPSAPVLELYALLESRRAAGAFDRRAGPTCAAVARSAEATIAATTTIPADGGGIAPIGADGSPGRVCGRAAGPARRRRAAARASITAVSELAVPAVSATAAGGGGIAAVPAVGVADGYRQAADVQRCLAARAARARPAPGEMSGLALTSRM